MRSGSTSYRQRMGRTKTATTAKTATSITDWTIANVIRKTPEPSDAGTTAACMLLRPFTPGESEARRSSTHK